MRYLVALIQSIQDLFGENDDFDEDDDEDEEVDEELHNWKIEHKQLEEEIKQLRKSLDNNKDKNSLFMVSMAFYLLWDTTPDANLKYNLIA